MTQPSYLPPEGADTDTCRHCGNQIWVALAPLPAVFSPRPSWRDKYGSICEGGYPHGPLGTQQEEVTS